MNPMSSAAVAVTAQSQSSTFLYDRVRICELLHLPLPESSDLEVEPPHPGQFKFWTPNWNLIAVLNRAAESGLIIREAMHVRSKPFAKPTMASGYLTVPFTPPKCGNEKFRKPGQLKTSERLAPLSSVMMAILLRYLGDLDLLYSGRWLITADKCGDKTVCLLVGDEALVLDLHDDRRIQNADHACAVLLS